MFRKCSGSSEEEQSCKLKQHVLKLSAFVGLQLEDIMCRERLFAHILFCAKTVFGEETQVYL
jgi:hypothetical protein